MYVVDLPYDKTPLEFSFYASFKYLSTGHFTVALILHQACQTESWRHSHKYECKIFTRLYPSVLPNTARMALQILLRRQAGTIPVSDWDRFLDLRDHADDFKTQATADDETWGNVQLMARAAKEYSGSPEDLGRVELLVARVRDRTISPVDYISDSHSS